MLCAPVLVELKRDEDGDMHPNNDYIARGVGMVIMAAATALINPKLGFVLDFARGLVLSFGIFTFFFPYLINVVLYKKGVIKNHRWWNHLSKEAIPDKWVWWSSTPWFFRMMLLFIVFLACVKVYACPCKIASFYNNCF